MWWLRAFVFLLPGLAFGQLTRDWHAVRSPNFEIVSRYEPARIRPLVETLEWARSVLDLNFGWKSSSARPALVLLPDAPYDFERMVSSKHTGGFYLNAPWRDIIVLRELFGVRHALLHEYTHLVTRHQGAHYPAWFNEGLAEFFGSMEETAGVVEAGRKDPRRPDLTRFVWVPPAYLVSLKSTAELPSDDARLRFYAQAWLFVNMVRLSPVYRDKYEAFRSMLADGMGTEEALKRVYGKSAVQFDNDARDWARQKAIMVERLKSPPPSNGKIDQVVLNEIEVQIAQATVGASTRPGSEEAGDYARLSKLAGDGCGIQPALGDLALAASLPSKAAAHYRQAIDCGSAPKELADGIADSFGYGAPPRSEDLKPLAALGSAGRFSFLAGAGRFYDRDYDGALREFERATGLKPPDEFRKVRMTAIAQSALGRHADAQATAERLRTMAKDPEQKDAALLTWEDVRRARQQAETARTPGALREAVLRLYTRVEGRLIRVDCLGERARFWVSAGNQTRKLLIADPSEVVTGPEAGAPLEFGCGVQNRAVVIGFQPGPTAEPETEGRIRYLEFR